jgi:hypothetical protein
MAKLVILVPEGRRFCGRVLLLCNDGKTRLGPLRVLATASGWAARRHNNGARDWRRPYGHPPTGSYVIGGSLPPGIAPRARRVHRFGGLGALVLTPVGGDALDASGAGRRLFLVHGGPTDQKGRLRPTFGGFRLSDRDLNRLLGAINDAYAASDAVSSVEVSEVQTPTWGDASPSDRAGRFRPSSASDRVPPGPGMPLKHAALLALGSGLVQRRSKNNDAGALARLRRRDFVGLALLAVSALGSSGCGSGNDAPGPDTCPCGTPPRAVGSGGVETT